MDDGKKKFIENYIINEFKHSDNIKIYSSIHDSINEIILYKLPEDKKVLNTKNTKIWEFENKFYESFDDLWKKITRKNPHIKSLIETIKKNPIKEEQKSQVFQVLQRKRQVKLYFKIMKHKDWLKKYININEFKNLNFEQTNDKIDELYEIEKVEKFIRKYFSKKHQELIHKESKELIKILLNQKDITENQIKENFIKKIAMYKTSKEFYEGIKKFLEMNSNWYKENIKKQLLENNTEIVFEDNQKIVAEVKDQKSSTELGSTQWCISNSMEMFDSYTNHASRQFFIYDFSKQEVDPMSLIGITISKDNICQYAQDKNDIDIKDKFIKNNELKNLNIKPLKKDEVRERIINKRFQEISNKNDRDFQILIDLMSHDLLIEEDKKLIKEFISSQKNKNEEMLMNNIELLTRVMIGKFRKDYMSSTKKQNEINKKVFIYFIQEIENNSFKINPSVFLLTGEDTNKEIKEICQNMLIKNFTELKHVAGLLDDIHNIHREDPPDYLLKIIEEKVINLKEEDIDYIFNQKNIKDFNVLRNIIHKEKLPLKLKEYFIKNCMNLQGEFLNMGLENEECHEIFKNILKEKKEILKLQVNSKSTESYNELSRLEKIAKFLEKVVILNINAKQPILSNPKNQRALIQFFKKENTLNFLQHEKGINVLDKTVKIEPQDLLTKATITNKIPFIADLMEFLKKENIKLTSEYSMLNKKILELDEFYDLYTRGLIHNKSIEKLINKDPNSVIEILSEKDFKENELINILNIDKENKNLLKIDRFLPFIENTIAQEKIKPQKLKTVIEKLSNKFDEINYNTIMDYINEEIEFEKELDMNKKNKIKPK